MSTFLKWDEGRFRSTCRRWRRRVDYFVMCVVLDGCSVEKQKEKTRKPFSSCHWYYSRPGTGGKWKGPR